MRWTIIFKLLTIYMFMALSLLVISSYCFDSSHLKLNILLDKPSYELGDSIVASCEIINISKSTLWLPPLQFNDIRFRLYDNWNNDLSFEIPNMTFYGTDDQKFIELRTNQAYQFKRILNRDAYKIPVVGGQYRLCIVYENSRSIMRNIQLWVGKTKACVLLKIKNM